LKKSRRLEDKSVRKRHRLRLATKKLRYSIEFCAGLLPHENSSMRATLKYLRKAQESLGELNDAAEIQTLAARLRQNASTNGDSSHFLDGKRERELMRGATRAYRKMDALTSLSI
jgi:CHAD domain-containing protein